jgi:hypothetical protein
MAPPDGNEGRVTSATVRLHKDRAERTAKDSPWPARMARIGLLARGIIHLLVGWLAIRIATVDPSERVDQRGALAAVLRQPLGRVLVFVLALGFLAYAAWRVLEAVLDPDDKGVVQRIGYAARAVLYLGLFGTAVSMAVKGSSGSSGSSGGIGGQQEVAAGVLSMPFGRALVLAAGLVIIGTGVWNGYRAFSRSFEKKLKEAEMSPTERTWTIRAGFVGHLARMIAYFAVGGFLAQAALQYDPQKPVGLDASLHALAGKSYGPWLLVLVGAGLIAFGLYQVMLARYREVLDS